MSSSTAHACVVQYRVPVRDDASVQEVQTSCAVAFRELPVKTASAYAHAGSSTDCTALRNRPSRRVKMRDRRAASRSLLPMRARTRESTEFPCSKRNVFKRHAEAVHVRDGTTNSPATDGVAARMSAVKSAMVKSTSCPTALTTGMRDRAMALATTSSLNAQRSSMDPPPADRSRSRRPARILVAEVQRSGNLVRRSGTLHLHGHHEQLHGWIAAADDADHIAHGGAGRGC
jgi:hypothetical protein